MDSTEDPLTPVIEEIATLLATGYLRLHMARTASEAADSPALQVVENSIYSAQDARCQGAMRSTAREKGD
jgi:hypothetical protein